MTNQASEDVLKDQIDDVFARACKNNEYFGYDGWYELHTPTMRVEIKELIRTEKLKLLDRLDKQIEYNKHDMGEMGEFIRTVYAHNAIEAERNKMETELCVRRAINDKER